jgi:hypothetical protein
MVLGLLATAFAALTPLPAQSADGKRGGTGCEDTFTCVWTTAGFAGQKRKIDADPDQTWRNFAGDFKNDIEAVKNHFNNRRIAFAWGEDGNGNHYCVDAGSEISTIHFPNNDQFESFKVGTLGSSCPE